MIPSPDDPPPSLGPAWLAFFTPIHHYPPLADRKAAFLLSATGLICTVLLFFAGPIWHLMHVPYRPAGLAVAALVGLLVFLLALGAWNAWRGFITPIPPMPDSLAFFATIAAAPRERYTRAVKEIDYAQATRSILHYNYSLSIQARDKFKRVNRSFACFRVALVLWMFLLLVVSVAG